MQSSIFEIHSRRNYKTKTSKKIQINLKHTYKSYSFCKCVLEKVILIVLRIIFNVIMNLLLTNAKNQLYEKEEKKSNTYNNRWSWP